MSKIDILIADDHQIVRDGLTAMFESISDIVVKGELAGGREVLEYCENNEQPDVVLMDISMPDMDGIESTRQLKEKYPGIKILALTMMSEEQYVREMISAGGSGYIFKNTGMEELIEAVRTVDSGKHYFSDEATYAILNELQSGEKSQKKYENAGLTERELEVLEFICQEYTNPEIAEELQISVRTVDSHRRNLLQKTGARNTAGLVRYAVEHVLNNID